MLKEILAAAMLLVVLGLLASPALAYQRCYVQCYPGGSCTVTCY